MIVIPIMFNVFLNQLYLSLPLFSQNQKSVAWIGEVTSTLMNLCSALDKFTVRML